MRAGFFTRLAREGDQARNAIEWSGRFARPANIGKERG